MVSLRGGILGNQTKGQKKKKKRRDKTCRSTIDLRYIAGEERAQETMVIVHGWCGGENLKGLHPRWEIKYYRKNV